MIEELRVSCFIWFSLDCRGPKDSNGCLQNSPDWDSEWTCKNSIAYDKTYCDVDRWAKDFRRCCPDTCGTANLNEKECNELPNSLGTCFYPNAAQCTITGNYGIRQNFILNFDVDH